MLRRAWILLPLVGCSTDTPLTDEELGETVSEVNLADFTLPMLGPDERGAIVEKYDALDPTDLVPRGLLEDAMVYFDVNKAHVPSQHYLAIADMSLHSGKDRFWLVNLETGAVERHKVAHGDGSDPDNDGLATSFGNVDGSHKSSLGFYLTGEIYDGTHVHSMRLDGLSADGSPNGMANTNARSRLIVMHEASYVNDGSSSQQGRSNGCLALDPDVEVAVVDKLHDGSLIYSATTPLADPVGRGPHDPGMGSGSDMPADDIEDPPVDPTESGGCSTSGGAGALGASLIALLCAHASLRARRRDL